MIKARNKDETHDSCIDCILFSTQEYNRSVKLPDYNTATNAEKGNNGRNLLPVKGAVSDERYILPGTYTVKSK